MRKVTLSTLTCTQCGHTWLPRVVKVWLCPKCKSPRWNEPKEAK